MEIFRGERFSSRQFTGARIDHAMFIGCDFSTSNLTDTEFNHCHFLDRTTGQGSRFTGSILQRARFERCDLSHCDFRLAFAPGLSIVDCRAPGTDFRHSRMRPLPDDPLTGPPRILRSNLRGADFSAISLEACDLRDNRWSGAITAGTNFRAACLAGGIFTHFDWSTADFFRADLDRAVLGDLGIAQIQQQELRLDPAQLALLLQRLGIALSEDA
ncbi:MULTISPECIES: pentapeptide repeat-containing protein [Stenotrophomonas]|nr:pentapeptide repeat-containing protein [Stenotrophomonas maltophilia]